MLYDVDVNKPCANCRFNPKVSPMNEPCNLLWALRHDNDSITCAKRKRQMNSSCYDILIASRISECY